MSSSIPCTHNRSRRAGLYSRSVFPSGNREGGLSWNLNPGIFPCGSYSPVQILSYTNNTAAGWLAAFCRWWSCGEGPISDAVRSQSYNWKAYHASVVSAMHAPNLPVVLRQIFSTFFYSCSAVVYISVPRLPKRKTGPGYHRSVPESSGKNARWMHPVRKGNRFFLLWVGNPAMPEIVRWRSSKVLKIYHYCNQIDFVS